MQTVLDLKQRLSELTLAPAPKAERHAAVALLLRFDPDPSVLLMRRAERAGDRWSGQIGLPGGHAEEQDADLSATAVRETHEELGLELDVCAQPLGQLPYLQARSQHKRLPLYVTPFVFLEVEPAEPVLGPEATRAFWLPLAGAHAGELDGQHELPSSEAGELLRFPSWNFDGEVIWGMTHHIIGGLLDILHPADEGRRPPSGPA
ncbi:MAG: 8-oxo-dGTP pyrophosphatase MutT (NUDIX family) [Planctomycetota bacterium]|jgi:8-oxo-dGTP pyrophosphatase MutT (NUDIX family)